MDTSPAESYRSYRRYFVDLSRFYRRKKARVYTGIVLSLLTITFFLFFAIRPTVTTIASLIKDIQDKKIINEQLQDKINALNSAQKEYQATAASLHLVDEALPENPGLSLLVRQIEALARKDGIAVRAVQLEGATLKGEDEKQTEPKDDQGTRFSLAATGDYQQLKTFLASLTGLRRLVSVTAFTFQSDQETENLIVSLNAKAHYLKP